MSLAKVTAIGYEQLLQHDGTSLFEDAVFPASLDRNTIINTALARSGEFEVVYENPYFMKDLITNWAKSYYRTFEKWARVYFSDYDPLENYNRTEIWEDNDNRAKFWEDHDSRINSGENRVNRTEKTEDNQNRVESGKDLQTGVNNTFANSSIDGTTENKVSAYDSADYSPKDKEISDSDTASTGANVSNNSNVHNGSSHDKNIHEGDISDINAHNDLTQGSSKHNDLSHGNTKHEGHMFGNIGTMTSQQMGEAEYQIARFNIYEQIADLFIKEFCICVY